MTVPVDLDLHGCFSSVGCGGCEFSDGSWEFSTENSFGHLHGIRFVDGLKRGEGAILASWDDLPASSEGGEWCPVFREFFGGPGALWLAQHLNFPFSVKPEAKTVAHGEWASFITVLKNRSGNPRPDAKVCAIAHREGLRIEARPAREVGKQCGRTRDLAVGEKMETDFLVKATSEAEVGSYPLEFRMVPATDLASGRARLNVTRK
jgi:hypothetical protein